MAGNPCSKTVKPEEAYEVWKAHVGEWYWYILKKYQSPEREEKNYYARWYCWVKSPFISERGEYGDVYVQEIKAQAYKLDYNPLRSLKEKNNAAD